MKLIVLNHKMNILYNELDEYIDKINKVNNNLIIAPSNIYLLKFLENTHHKIASQDVCYIEDGNYTGKVSFSQIKSLGVRYSLIGHSEKNDNIDKINYKLKRCIDSGIIQILCFGNSNYDEEITDILDKIEYLNNMIIYAYEPIFNIGIDEIDLSYIEENIDIIYNYLINKGIMNPMILYGGGINKNNINKIYHIKNISGIVLGSKSSDIDFLENLLLEIDEK